MKHLPLQDLLLASLFSVTALYGYWNLLTEVFKTILPFGLFLVSLIFCAFYFLRVPPPSPEAVEAVIGKDPLHADQGEYVMKTVAHRGAGLDAPENSLEAFRMCAQKGCDVIEFDVSLTKDEVPIVFHDNNLERMTDLKMVIGEHNWADLANVDISVKHVFKDRFTKTNIPTLEQTVTQLLSSGQRMFIDIKDNNMKLVLGPLRFLPEVGQMRPIHYQFVKIIHSLFERHPELYSKAVVSSFFPNIIYLIRRGDPKIVCSLAWRPHAFAYDSYNYPIGKGIRRAKAWYKHHFLKLCDILHEWTLHRITYYFLGLSVILLHKDVAAGRSLLEWRKRGVRVMVWTVNAPAEKQYFARVLKVTYLTDTLTGEGTTHSPSI